MGRSHSGAVVALVILAACGGGGGGSGSGTALDAGRAGVLALLSHQPAEDAVQVAIDSSITLLFDAPIALESFGDQDTWLHESVTGANVSGSFRLTSPDTVVFTPSSPLRLETDYLFQLSPLTCDIYGRIVEDQHQFAFRTLDTTPPTVSNCSLGEGQTSASRTAPITLTFSEAIAASTAAAAIRLRDGYGINYPISLAIAGAIATVTPLADLPGDRSFLLSVARTLTDRAGNGINPSWSRTFRTIGDVDQPALLTVWPASGSTGVSPTIEPRFTFDESMDPYTVEAGSLLFQDQYGSVIAFSVLASDDQRTLRIHPTQPLLTGRSYTLAFLLGAAAATDVSGNPLDSTGATAFTVGSDATPPTITRCEPANGETHVSFNAVPLVHFQEALSTGWLPGNVELLLDEVPVVAVIELILGATTVRITPVEPLPTSSRYTIRLHGGSDGLHDLAGNPFATDTDLTFTTTADATLPSALLMPGDGSAAVPRNAHVAIVFAEPIDPATVNASSVQVLDAGQSPVDGTLSVGGGNRTVTFTPSVPWTGGANYRTVVHGGRDGVRETSGNWLGDDLTAAFRAGFANDTLPPTVSVTLNRVDAARKQDQTVPTSGFTIDVSASDPVDLSLDMASVLVVLNGPGTAPTAAAVFAGSEVGTNTFHYLLPAEAALATGDWTVTASVRDLAGNLGSSPALAFHVDPPADAQLPFERTQVVWVRSDLDRNGNGRGDFLDDLVRLGLATDGDPAGTNARIEQIALEAVMRQAFALFGRGSRGEPLGPASVRIRYTLREPIALAHMQMALGGLDPDGNRNRVFGDASTGILGRAYYDRCNSRVNERNIGVAPGLGVFPGEMFLYQARIHQQVYPSFLTLFAQRFMPLCPDMGGTPVGMHALDSAVLATGFDFANASSQQRARYETIMNAVDDWAHIAAVILDHEVGHATGLVPPGPAPSGLYGDSTLHDDNSSAAEIMAAAVGYEAMVTLDYHFRDVDLGYLRQRILLR